MAKPDTVQRGQSATRRKAWVIATAAVAAVALGAGLLGTGLGGSRSGSAAAPAASNITLYTAGTPNGELLQPAAWQTCSLGAAGGAAAQPAPPTACLGKPHTPFPSLCVSSSCAGWKASICLEELGLQVGKPCLPSCGHACTSADLRLPCRACSWASTTPWPTGAPAPHTRTHPAVPCACAGPVGGTAEGGVVPSHQSQRPHTRHRHVPLLPTMPCRTCS